MSGGSGSQTTKQEPWSGQKPFLTDLYQQSQDAFRSTDPTPYQGPLTAPATANQLDGMNAQLGVANAISQSGMAGSTINLGGQFGNKASSGYYMQPARMQYDPQGLDIQDNYDAEHVMPSLMDGPMSQFMGPEGTARAIETIAGERPDYADANLEEAIAGQLRPYERRLTEEILPQAQSQAIMQGAYGGSGDLLSRQRALRDLDREAADVTAQYTFQDILSQRQQEAQDYRTLANLAAQSGDRMSQQIFQDAARARDLEAQSYEQGRQLDFQDQSRQRDIEFADLSQRRQLMPTLMGLEQDAAQLGTQLQNTGIQQALLPGKIQSQVGQRERQFQQQQIDAALQRHQMEQAAPWTGMQQYANLIYGSPQFSTTSQTGQQAGGGVGGAASGALSGAATGAMAGSVIPGIGTGVGAAAGGILGGLGGFL